MQVIFKHFIADSESKNKKTLRRIKDWLDLRQNSSAWEKRITEEGYDKRLQNDDMYGWRSAGQCLV